MIAPEDRYSCICSSIIRFAQDFRASENPDATYFDWDAHSDVSQLPETDVIGPAGIGIENEGKLERVVFGLGIATVGDENLFRLRSLVSKMYGRLQPETTIPVYDPEGTIDSWMVVTTPVTVAPVSKSEIRAIQFVSLVALLDPHASSSL